ncbi:MAG TPA: penicillin-binding protein 2 [Bryobacteraceae bacterium]|nr:penicillin-binding protein 2 [Bryobacteraceae bacterium]
MLREQLRLHDDTQFAGGRIAVFQYTTVIAFLLLISGFWKLQVQNPDYYAEKAQQNRIRSRPLLAPRGRILDRDGRVIVDNLISSTLLLTRENLRMEDLAPIAEGLNLDLDDLEEKVRHKSREPKYEAIRLKDELTPADLAFVNSHRDAFPELDVIQSRPRLYPQDGMMAHVIGYTGEISGQELDSPDFANYKLGDVIGKSGIERQYNDTLMGDDGQQRVEVDNRGQVRHAEEEKPAIPGKDLRLTVDLDLQAVAELAMEGKNGAVVALDPRTGEILAMVSRPTFDPNKFVGHISTSDWNAINGNPDHPLLNRAIQAQQAPGSTFKPIVALAALETGAITEQTPIRCPGYLTLYDHTYHCMEKQGHGTLTLHNAIVHSCDVFFFSVGVKLGIDNLAKYAGMVGFGRPTGVDLPGEAAGLVPSPSQKARTQRQPWYAGDTPPVAVGQGALTVTPLQLARAIGGLAMGGVWHTPHLVRDDALAAKTTQVQFDPAHLQAVIDGMYGVVNEGGTGAPAALPGIELCGKTGTAQLASLDKEKSEAARHGGMNLKENAWFVGFAPRQNPQIVVVALFDHGGVGQYAATIVRDVVKSYFDKRTRLETWRQERSTVVAVGSFLHPPVAENR